MPEPDWRSTVRVRPRPDVAQGWTRADPTGPRPVSVTSLLELRPSYFQRVHPLPFAPEEQARLADGRALHAELGARLSARPEQREVRVRREGIVGQIDWLTTFPTELKTTGTVPPIEQLARQRPQYVDQLAMYCALTGVDHGMIMVVPAQGAPIEAASSVRVEFDGLDQIWSEMRRRAESLRAAREAADPSALPRCPWFGRGCAYQTSGVCPCSGDEPETPSLAVDRLRRLERDAASEAALRAALREVLAQPPPFPEQFTDLLYPRRAFFRRISPPGEAVPRSWPRSEARDILYRRTVEGIESSDPGGQGRLLPSRGGIREPVPRMEGRPYLIKITRARPRPTPEAMIAEQSQYFLELGLRCHAVGASSGWLVVGYERPGPDGAEIVPYEVAFDPPEPIARVAETREAALRNAVATGRPDDLPKCPEWMFAECPYRARCGCGPLPSGPSR